MGAGKDLELCQRPSAAQTGLRELSFTLASLSTPLTPAQLRQQTCLESAAPGRRKFQDFLAEYCEPVPGRYRDVANGAVLGNCANIVPRTLGQRAGLGGAPSRYGVMRSHACR